MKIAICDDEELLCSKIEKIILEYGEANNICLENVTKLDVNCTLEVGG
ncbi:hypothetical protein [Aminipila sp.]|nr:hypothetical protein [Aminipila sp.]